MASMPREQSLRNMLRPGWQCCFCGQPIDDKPPDPCRMALRYNTPQNPEMVQEAACHVECFTARAHPSMVFAPFDLK